MEKEEIADHYPFVSIKYRMKLIDGAEVSCSHDTESLLPLYNTYLLITKSPKVLDFREYCEYTYKNIKEHTDKDCTFVFRV